MDSSATWCYALARENLPKRNKLDIWASILQLVLDEDQATLTWIVVSVRLNRQSGKNHIRQLLAEGLIQTREGRFTTYSITQRGIEWLRRYSGLAGVRFKNNRDF